MNDKFPSLPATKEWIDKLIQDYFIADNHQWPDWMGIDQSDNEVRYDYDSSKVCYSLLRYFQPTNCLEFGTSYGHSALFTISALFKNNKPFHYLGYEILESIYEQAKNNVARQFGDKADQGKNKFIRLINEDITKSVYPLPQKLDFVFIDTDHDAENTKWYLKNVLPLCKKGALIAIHDLPVQLETNGRIITKDDLGEGKIFAETDILKELYNSGKLPLEPIYFMYQDRDRWGNKWEGSWWLKK